MEKTLLFIDGGFLSKLSKYYGKGKYIKYDVIKLAKVLSKKQCLLCAKIFYYTAPPFQSEPLTKEEIRRKERYDSFIKKLSKYPEIIVREGRCQRLKVDGKFIYKQKGVDTLAIIDLMSIPIENPDIKKIILIASDSDFVPVIKHLEKLTIQTLLCTYYLNKRNTNFSRSNNLLNSVHRYFKLSRQDFDNALLDKKQKREN